MDELDELLEKTALVFSLVGGALRMRVCHCGRAGVGEPPRIPD